MIAEKRSSEVMKPGITQAQLEAALMVSHHGNHDLLRDGVAMACRAIMAGQAGLTESAPVWLQGWGGRAEAYCPGTVIVLMPLLSNATLAGIVESGRHSHATGEELIVAARTEIANRQLS